MPPFPLGSGAALNTAINASPSADATGTVRVTISLSFVTKMPADVTNRLRPTTRMGRRARKLPAARTGRVESGHTTASAVPPASDLSLARVTTSFEHFDGFPEPLRPRVLR